MLSYPFAFKVMHRQLSRDSIHELLKGIPKIMNNSTHIHYKNVVTTMKCRPIQPMQTPKIPDQQSCTPNTTIPLHLVAMPKLSDQGFEHGICDEATITHYFHA